MSAVLTWIGDHTNPQSSPSGDSLAIADRVYYTEVLHGKEAVINAEAVRLPRGNIATFAIPGVSSANWIVEEAVTSKDKWGKATLTRKWALLTTPPPSEWSLIPLELNPPITAAGYFSSLSEDDRDKVYAARHAATPELRFAIQSKWLAGGSAALMNSLLAKWRRGMETFYVAGMKFQFSSYSFTSPGCTAGGYRETPGNPGGYTLPTLSWLRLADEITCSSGLYKKVSTWLGGPSGHWDTDIYPAA